MAVRRCRATEMGRGWTDRAGAPVATAVMAGLSGCGPGASSAPAHDEEPHPEGGSTGERQNQRGGRLGNDRNVGAQLRGVDLQLGAAEMPLQVGARRGDRETVRVAPRIEDRKSVV